MAVKSNNKENQGFKLLQEDSLDDRPCAAVKNFVASVLDKKDLKDQDVAASFRNVSSVQWMAGGHGYVLDWEIDLCLGRKLYRLLFVCLFLTLSGLLIVSVLYDRCPLVRVGWSGTGR